MCKIILSVNETTFVFTGKTAIFSIRKTAQIAAPLKALKAQRCEMILKMGLAGETFCMVINHWL